MCISSLLSLFFSSLHWAQLYRHFQHLYCDNRPFSPPSVPLFSHSIYEVIWWSHIRQLFRYRWVLLFFGFNFYFSACMGCHWARRDRAWPQTLLRLIGSICFSDCFQVAGSCRTGIHTGDTNFKFHLSHRPGDLQQLEQLIYTEFNIPLYGWVGLIILTTDSS